MFSRSTIMMVNVNIMIMNRSIINLSYNIPTQKFECLKKELSRLFFALLMFHVSLVAAHVTPILLADLKRLSF